MKHHLRKEMRTTLAGMPPAIATIKGRQACDALIDLPEFQTAGVIMVYLDIPNEVDAAPVVQAAWASDKTVLVPKVTWEHKQMKAIEIYSLRSGLLETPQGLREPPEGEPWPVDRIDFIVVPALAYDRSGNRLGRGGGFYDRFLASPKMHATTCGLAFSEQLVDELPVHANDYPVDILVTDEQVLRFNSTAHVEKSGLNRQEK